MTRTPATPEFEPGKLLPALIKQAFLWGPIVAGVVHQFLMVAFKIERIYVFVDPPGYIRPLVALKFQWWIVLLLASAIISVLAYTDRLKGVPRRVALPFYLYILFLLILVKPV